MSEHHNARSLPSQRSLTELGRRLRQAREERGLSVSDLALRAGVSRRYLTEAEAGRANLSVLKLIGLAESLDLDAGDLLRRPEVQRERIALVGLRGAGKSTLGRQLALDLEAPFVELDERVEALAGLRLAEIFALQGEEGFHRYEAEALEQVLAEGERLVLAVGGSIVANPANYERLRRTCRTVWLRARPEEHYARVLAQGDRRPMAGRPRARDELEALLAARAPLYARCELVLETSGRTVEQARTALSRLLSHG